MDRWKEAAGTTTTTTRRRRTRAGKASKSARERERKRVGGWVGERGGERISWLEKEEWRREIF